MGKENRKETDQTGQRPQRRDLSNDCTEVQQISIVINCNLPQNMCTTCTDLVCGLSTSNIFHTAAHVSLAHRIDAKMQRDGIAARFNFS